MYQLILLSLIIPIVLPSISLAKDVLVSVNSLTQSPSNYYIISIGVNDYQDKFWPKLKWPANDAKRIAEHFGVNTTSHSQKFVFTDTNSSVANIKSALNTVEKRAKQSDTVVLYISSHGTLVQNTSGELERIVVINDTKNDDLINTGLTHRYLYAWMDRLKARKKLAVFATCHSGEGKSRLPSYIHDILKSTKGTLIPLSEASEGTLVLAAAAQGESAREDDRLQGDIYTHYLIHALTTYDRNRDGMVTALEAHDYAREKTWNFTQGQQRPTANASLIGDADIPLFGKKNTLGLPILEAYDDELSGFELRVDSGLKGKLPMAFPLLPSGNIIALYAPGSDTPTARYKIELPPGHTITLKDVLTNRPIGFSFQELFYTWQDSDWNSLAGNTSFSVARVGFFLHTSSYAFGVLTSLPIKKKHVLRPALESKIELTDIIISMRYNYRLSRVALIGNLSSGFEHLHLAFTDTTINQSLDYKDWSYTYGYELGLAYMVDDDIAVSLTYARHQSLYQFSKLGNLSGTRAGIGIGFQFRFNPKIRRL